MDAVKDRTNSTEQQERATATSARGTVTLKAGTRVTAPGGWPVYLTADVAVETNASNIPLIERDMVADADAPIASDR